MKTFFAIILFAIAPRHIVAQIIWQKSFGGSADEIAHAVCQTTDSGFLVAGLTSSNDGDVTGFHGDGDFWVVKISSNGNLQWQKSLGGSSGQIAYSIVETHDGGSIVSGYTDSDDGDVNGNHGQHDFWAVKLSGSGAIEWQKCLGGSLVDDALSIRQTFDNGFVIAGTTYSNDGDVSGNHGNSDCWITKLSDSGVIQWQKCFGGSDYDGASEIAQTNDSGFILVGGSSSNDGDVSGNHGGGDYCIIKLSPTGSLQWQKSLGGSFFDGAFSVCQTFDNGYAIVGYTESADGDVSGNHGQQDYWVVKLDPSGTLQWQKCLGGSGWDYGYSIRQTTDSGFIIAGYTASNDGEISGYHTFEDYWIVKLSSYGAFQWQKCLGGNGQDHAYAVQQTYDGNFIVAGSSSSNDGDVSGNHGGKDFWVAKFGPVTGTEELTPPAKISISPNPTYDNIMVNGIERTNIRVYNILGRLVAQAANTNTISISQQPAGTYIVELYDNQQQLVCRDKIVKY